MTKYNPLPISRIERNGKREKFDNDKIPAILSTLPPFVLMLIFPVFFRIRYQYTTLRLSCVSGYGVSCSAPVTNTIVKQVVLSPSAITPTAASSLVSVNISNSSVTLANQNSSKTENGTKNGTENGTETREYTPLFQNFMLKSSVVFIKVPSVKPQPVKR